MVSVNQMARLVDCGFLTEEQYQKRVMGQRVTVVELLNWLSKYDILTFHFNGEVWDTIAGAETVSDNDPVESLVKAVEAVQKEKANPTKVVVKKIPKPAKFPEFIEVLGGSVVRLVEEKGNTAKYFRDAGVWDVWVKWEDEQLICRNNKGMMKHANGTLARECSKEDWKKDNRGYI